MGANVERARSIFGEELEEWPRRYDQLAPDKREAALQTIYAAWVDGELTSDPERDREIGRVLSSLPDEWDRVVIDRVNPTADEVRRWCWGRDWILMPDDEDLLLMDDRYVEQLCDEARRGCTKREYALGILMHHTRDSAHHAVFDGDKAFQDRTRELARWLPWARAANSPHLVAYLERLVSYGAIREVTRGEVEQCVLDLRRCDPRPDDAPKVKRVGPNWVANLELANVTPGELYVEAATGKTWAEKQD
jgi:hypothetical protein